VLQAQHPSDIGGEREANQVAAQPPESSRAMRTFDTSPG